MSQPMFSSCYLRGLSCDVCGGRDCCERSAHSDTVLMVTYHFVLYDHYFGEHVMAYEDRIDHLVDQHANQQL